MPVCVRSGSGGKARQRQRGREARQHRTGQDRVRQGRVVGQGQRMQLVNAIEADGMGWDEMGNEFASGQRNARLLISSSWCFGRRRADGVGQVLYDYGAGVDVMHSYRAREEKIRVEAASKSVSSRMEWML